MKKPLLILLCLPFIGFGQDNKEAKFNFNKSNNYQTLKKEAISNQYYSSQSTFNFKQPIKRNNDSIFNYVSHPNNNARIYPFNKGLIHIISEAIQKGSNDKSSIFKKQEEKLKINQQEINNE